ncbi:MAG: hypothetical protein HC831_31710 [Chloroflexia bacterium]|nr:hypothetical protein [Chloroflexia bacterium]
MHEIFETRVWALESFYLQRAKAAILKGLEKGDLSNLAILNPEKKREAAEYYSGLSWNRDLGAYIHSGIEGKT